MSRVYKSKTILIASKVSLVESKSRAPLIPLVGELMDSKGIRFFFKCRIIFSPQPKAARQISDTVPENFKP